MSTILLYVLFRPSLARAHDFHHTRICARVLQAFRPTPTTLSLSLCVDEAPYSLQAPSCTGVPRTMPKKDGFWHMPIRPSDTSL